MREQELGTYEMLWDCPFCGTGGLLGLTHRHCPACGGAQDPAARYYPSDEQKVAVKDHVFFGADVVCPACATPNGASSQFCAGCGSPLQGGQHAAARGDQVAAAGQQFAGESIKDAKAEARAHRMATVDATMGKAQPEGMSKGLKIGLIVGGIVMVLLAAVLTLIFWKTEVALTADGHTWSRTIGIEVFDSVNESAWCDRMPKKAYSVKRSKEQRSTKKIPDGEECKTRRKDNRDGTFKQVKECKPKYREEPVYDQKCRFKIDKWAEKRKAKAEGSSKDPAPSWPEIKLAKTGTCKGCEREGAKKETYVVKYADPASEETHDCEVSQSTWESVEPGSKWKAEVGVVSTSLDCDSLVAAD